MGQQGAAFLFLEEGAILRFHGLVHFTKKEESVEESNGAGHQKQERTERGKMEEETGAVWDRG